MRHSLRHLPEGNPVIVIIVNFSLFFELFSSYEHFSANTKYSDTASPAGHIGLGLGAIRALSSAWRALTVFPGESG